MAVQEIIKYTVKANYCSLMFVITKNRKQSNCSSWKKTKQVHKCIFLLLQCLCQKQFQDGEATAYILLNECQRIHNSAECEPVHVKCTLGKIYNRHWICIPISARVFPRARNYADCEPSLTKSYHATLIYPWCWARVQSSFTAIYQQEFPWNMRTAFLFWPTD